MKTLQLDIPLLDKEITQPVPIPHVQYHPEGTAFIENNIPLVSPQYDADVKTGRALELGATNDLPIPTHVDGYITYYNLDTDTITQEATDGTDKVFNTITINNILTHQMPFSEGDLTLIQQEPNLLAALAMGEATPISSVTLDADDSWYACGEVSGADVFDARVAGNDTTISGDLTNVRITNQQKGLQTTALLLDANGVPESYNSTPNTARVYDDTIISTGFKPSIARYSIEESVSGELANFNQTIVDPSFDNPSAWTTTLDASVSGGQAILPLGTASSMVYQDDYVYSIGDELIVEIDFAELDTSATSFGVALRIALVEQVNITNPNDTGAYTYSDTITATENGSMRLRILSSLSSAIINSITINIAGSTSQRTEKRLLTKSALGENRYYIGTDGGAMVEQDVVPPLPDPNTTINLGNVAVIGYADTIESREAEFNVHSEVIVPMGKPRITIIGDNPATTIQGDPYNDEGATAMDAEDGDLTSEIQTVNNVDINIVGDYTVTYTVDDSSGNTTVSIRDVEVVDIPIEDTPPIYLMTEPLEAGELYNSSGSGAQYNGIFSGAVTYIEDDTIELGDESINTQYIEPSGEVKSLTFIYDVIKGSQYKQVTLHNKGNGDCDVWRGQNVGSVKTDMALAPADTNLSYTPSLSPIEITDNLIKELIPTRPYAEITLSSYALGIGDTAVVTLDFNTLPSNLTVDMIEAQNSTISNLVQDPDSPWIYTALLTPDEDVNDDTNICQIYELNPIELEDQWGNKPNASSISDNFTINTVEETSTFTYVSYDGTTPPSTPDPAGVTVNHFSGDGVINQVEVSLLNQDGIDDGMSYTQIVGFDNVSYDGNTVSGDNSMVLPDSVMEQAGRNRDGANGGGISLNLPAGTYNVLFSSFSGSAITTGAVTAGHAQQNMDATLDDDPAIFTNVVSAGEVIDFDYIRVDDRAIINGFSVEKIG